MQHHPPSAHTHNEEKGEKKERERENPMSCAHVVNETNETDMKMSRQSIGEARVRMKGERVEGGWRRLA